MGRKTTEWTFQVTNKRNLTREDLDIAKKGKPSEKETESLLIATKNIAIGTNYVEARIDKTQQNSICRLCDDRDETINHIISEWCMRK